MERHRPRVQLRNRRREIAEFAIYAAGCPWDCELPHLDLADAALQQMADVVGLPDVGIVGVQLDPERCPVAGLPGRLIEEPPENAEPTVPA